MVVSGALFRTVQSMEAEYIINQKPMLNNIVLRKLNSRAIGWGAKWLASEKEIWAVYMRNAWFENPVEFHTPVEITFTQLRKPGGQRTDVDAISILCKFLIDALNGLAWTDDNLDYVQRVCFNPHEKSDFHGLRINIRTVEAGTNKRRFETISTGLRFASL